MTEKLYYQNVYLKEFTAVIQKVKAADDGVWICMDRTAFYPEGGGQGADHGHLTLSDGRVLDVADVQETDGEIWHYIPFIQDHPGNSLGVSADTPDSLCMQKSSVTETIGQNPGNMAAGFEGTHVTGEIDWERRFDHMQQHSGEHIVSGMICERFHCDNVGFHLGEDVVTIDFNHRIRMEDAEEIEDRANRYLWENHPFEELWPTEKELQTLAYRSKKELEGAVRIVRFPDADTCACCGLHVTESAQIGLVKFLSARNFHEGTRLELLCGQRAARFLSMNYRVNKAAAVLMSTSEENTAEYVAKLIQETIRLKADCAMAQDRMLRMWARTFRGQGDVCLVDDTLDPSNARPLADLIADSCEGRAAVFVKDKDNYRYAVIQRDADISGFIKEMNQALQGRGGGRGGFAQGTVSAAKNEIERFFAAFSTAYALPLENSAK